MQHLSALERALEQIRPPIPVQLVCFVPLSSGNPKPPSKVSSGHHHDDSWIRDDLLIMSNDTTAANVCVPYSGLRIGRRTRPFRNSIWCRLFVLLIVLCRKPSLSENTSKLRILYIITSVHEFDNGKRETIKGHDRFSNILLPAAQESTSTMLQANYEVDLYLITHYKLSESRYTQLRSALPRQVGLQVWDDATPIGYDLDGNDKSRVEPIVRSLARQHRYVIKDKLLEYDFFVAFEDDMVVKGEHVQQYWKLTQQLYQLRQLAPSDSLSITSPDVMRRTFHGNMTRYQLERLIPGYIRVEVALEGFRKHHKLLFEQIPVDYDWFGVTGHINASICCQLFSSARLPPSPTSHDLYYWETGIDALSVRQLPSHEWVLLLAGNTEQWYEESRLIVGRYWAGEGILEHRPDPTMPQYMSNQGGWMATRRQIVDWNQRWCRGRFLPPYESPAIALDGLDRQTVEFWSGGIQIAGVLGCNLQRIVSLDPDGFSRHLLYHTANNKQKQRNIRYRFSSRTIQEFWGQLNTVRKNAEKQRGSELVEAVGVL